MCGFERDERKECYRGCGNVELLMALRPANIPASVPPCPGSVHIVAAKESPASPQKLAVKHKANSARLKVNPPNMDASIDRVIECDQVADRSGLRICCIRRAGHICLGAPDNVEYYECRRDDLPILLYVPVAEYI